LNVTIDQGEGSAATVTRIMSGAYDAGFGDMNAIIQNAAARPGEAPVMVYMIYNQPPFGIVTKADGPIKSLKDLEGRKLGGPAGSAATRMFPFSLAPTASTRARSRSSTCSRTCRSRC
jgi:NitT/TauT family transport system substrate-binding protein